MSQGASVFFFQSGRDSKQDDIVFFRLSDFPLEEYRSWTPSACQTITSWSICAMICCSILNAVFFSWYVFESEMWKPMQVAMFLKIYTGMQKALRTTVQQSVWNSFSEHVELLYSAACFWIPQERYRKWKWGCLVARTRFFTPFPEL